MKTRIALLAAGVALAASAAVMWGQAATQPDQAKGKIRINHDSWSIELFGPAGKVALSGSKEPVELPPGKYTLVSYVIRAQPANGQPMVAGRGPVGAGNQQKFFTVTADKLVNLPVGPPLTAKVQAELLPSGIMLSLVLTDASGSKVAYLLGEGGKPPPEPKVTIVDASGKAVHETTLEYG